MGLLLSTNALKIKYPVKIPIIKKDSIKFMKLAWSFLLDVTRPMVAKTETLIRANPAPVIANKTFVIAKPPIKGIKRQPMITNNNASSMDLLYPILAMYDATRNETMAMLRSLKASSMLAADWVTP